MSTCEHTDATYATGVATPVGVTASRTQFDLLGFTVSISAQQTASNGHSCEPPQTRRSRVDVVASF